MDPGYISLKRIANNDLVFDQYQSKELVILFLSPYLLYPFPSRNDLKQPRRKI